MARKRHYINNRDFYDALCTYLNDCSIAEDQGKPLPQVPNYVAKAFMLLCDRIGSRANFGSYSYLDEMKGDALLNCIAQVRSFNPQKSQNPFAYFTTVIKNAYIRKIKSEKVQHYIKIKNLDNLSVNDEIAGITTQQNLHNEITDEYVRDFESKNNVKKPGPKKKKAVVALETDNRFVSIGMIIEVDENETKPAPTTNREFVGND